MTKTRIEWTDRVWNPVTGCSKVSEGCRFCYAERLFPRVYGNKWVGGGGEELRLRRFSDVLCHPYRLDAPLKWRKPARVFVNSMSDLFHEDVPDEFIDRVFAAMGLPRRHTFQVLTKRPERMRDYVEGLGKDFSRIEEAARDLGRTFTFEGLPLVRFPLPNVWLGVSVESQERDARIVELLKTPAAVRFVSFEPLLGSVALDPEWLAPIEGGAKIDWIIVGGESGPKARPMHPEWARSIRDQATAAGVPFFFKQWGEWSPVEVPGAVRESQQIGRKPYRYMYLVGKKYAGRELDGRIWEEYPG